MNIYSDIFTVNIIIQFTVNIIIQLFTVQAFIELEY